MRRRLCSESRAAQIGPGEPLVVDEVAEEFPVPDEGQRVRALGLRRRRQQCPAGGRSARSGSLLVDALRVPGPAGDDGCGEVHRAAALEIPPDHGEQELGNPVRGAGRVPGEGVADVGVGEPR